MTPLILSILIQAQSCLAETGVYNDKACIAMTYVHLDRAERMDIPFHKAVCAYSSPMKRDNWVTRLGFDGRVHRKNRSCPTTLSPKKPKRQPSWTRGAKFQEAWHRTVGVVIGVLVGTTKNTCPGAVHYGSRPDGNRWPERLTLACRFGRKRKLEQLFYRRKRK